MGYESKFIIGETYDYDDGNPKWVREFAVFDMGKMGYETEVGLLVAEAHKNQKENPVVYFHYATDGDTIIDEDKYGDRLALVDREKLIVALIFDNMDEWLWQDKALVALLREIPDNYIILHSGY